MRREGTQSDSHEKSHAVMQRIQDREKQIAETGEFKVESLTENANLYLRRPLFLNCGLFIKRGEVLDARMGHIVTAIHFIRRI